MSKRFLLALVSLGLALGLCEGILRLQDRLGPLIVLSGFEKGNSFSDLYLRIRVHQAPA